MATTTFISFLGLPLKKDWESLPAAALLKEKAPAARAQASVLHAYHGKAVDPNAPPAAEIIVGMSRCRAALPVPPLPFLWHTTETDRQPTIVHDTLANAIASKDAQGDVKAAFKELADTSNPEIKPLANIFELTGSAFTAVAAAPVVLFAKWEVPAASKAAFEAELAKLSANGPPPAKDGAIGGAHGWGLELTPEGNNVFIVTTGWESVAKAEAQKADAEEKSKALDAIGQHVARFTVLEKVK